MGAYTYILRCSDGTLYTGWTDDLDKRVAKHNRGQGAKYTRARLPVTLVYSESHENRAAAQRRENAVKRLTRGEKLALIQQRGGTTMANVPTIEQATALLEQYNKEEFHLRHAKIVSGVMRWFAERHDPDNTDFWAVVGLLHDLDFEQYPDDHCVKGAEILRENGVDERVIHAAMSHGYSHTKTDAVPEAYMEKVLYAVDELTGLIGAVAIMRPSKSVSDLELKSVMKKFKTPAFAAGCNREVITEGAEKMGVTVEELIEQTIQAMRSLMDGMGI